MMKLRPIPKNATIGVICPSSSVNNTRLKRGIRYLSEQGYKLKVGQSCTSNWHYLSMEDEARAEELQSFFADDEVDAIICARGGYGCIRLLPLLDFDEIAKSQKAFVGYSDITAFAWALWAKCKMPSISGSMVAADYGDTTIQEQSKENGLSFLQNGQLEVHIPLENSTAEKWVSQHWSGRLMPGTLSVFTKLLGTSYFPDLNNAMPLIEDIGEPSRKLDGYIHQLLLSSHLEKIESLLIGDFRHRLKADEQEYPETVYLNPLEKYGISYITGWPFGHTPDKMNFPVGIECTLEVVQQKAVLRSTEALFDF